MYSVANTRSICANCTLQLFVLESRDSDTESRNFGPVHFGLANGTSVDLVVAAMDQGWCFAYTCQERLSTFWTYLPSECPPCPGIGVCECVTPAVGMTVETEDVNILGPVA